LGVFQKVSSWLTEKSDRFVRGIPSDQNGYYANEQDARAYQMNEADDYADGEYAEGESAPVEKDPFSYGDSQYGGRVPYRSRMEQEEEAAAQQQAQYQAAQLAQYQAQQAQYQAQQAQYQAQQQAQYRAQQQPQQAVQQPQQPVQQPQQSNTTNVVTFPGMQHTPDGRVYAHVEYIVQLCNRDDCRNIIDYIRANASVFLNMELIESDVERQRCVDMLSGAAYALGCALNKISPRGIYLISSPSVNVVMDTATKKMTNAPEVRGYQRQHYDWESYQAGSRTTQQQPVSAQPAEPAQPMGRTTGGFSSGSPTQRFQSQGAQGMPVSFGTAMAGSHTGMYRAVNASNQRYAQDYAQ